VELNDLVTVYMASNDIEAEIIKNALQGEGIKCFVEGRLQAAESGLAGIPVRIECAAQDADRARKFIENHRHHHQQHPHPHHKPG
jgi:Putative prokaryotic signal transducing protein